MPDCYIEGKPVYVPNRMKWTQEQREIADADHDDLAPRFSDEDEDEEETEE